MSRATSEAMRPSRTWQTEATRASKAAPSRWPTRCRKPIRPPGVGWTSSTMASKLSHGEVISVYHCATSGSPPFNTLPLQVQARGYQGLHYRFQLYTFDHGAVLAPCISDGLDYLLSLG